MAVRAPRGVYTRTLGDWFADDFAVWDFSDITGTLSPGAGLLNTSNVGESYYIYMIHIMLNVPASVDMRIGLKSGGTLGTAGNSVFYLDNSREQVTGQAWSHIVFSKTFWSIPLMYFGMTQARFESAIGEPLAIIGNGDMLGLIATAQTVDIIGHAFYLPVTEVGPRPGS